MWPKMYQFVLSNIMRSQASQVFKYQKPVTKVSVGFNIPNRWLTMVFRNLFSYQKHCI